VRHAFENVASQWGDPHDNEFATSPHDWRSPLRMKIGYFQVSCPCPAGHQEA
jgi:hypothetical protein